MNVNWEALTAIGTVLSAFLGVLGLLIALRSNYNEKKKARPNLKLRLARAKSRINKKNGFLYIQIENITHFEINIQELRILFFTHVQTLILCLNWRDLKVG